MQLTTFAAVLASALLARSMNLAGLLLVSTVLQATSVMNVPVGDSGGKGVAAYGVSPYMIMALVVGLVLMVRLVQDHELRWPRQLRWSLGWLFAYVVVAVAGALVLPQQFAGLPVNLLVEMHGILAFSPLKPSLANVVQSINLCVHGVVLLFMLQAAQRSDGLRGVVAGTVGALGLVLVVGFYQQWASWNGLPGWLPFLANNPGYEQASVAGQFIWFRVGLPFTEPSYASAYLAATSLGCWAVVFWGSRWWWAVLAALLSTAGLLNSLGATGLAAAGGAMLILGLAVMVHALRPSTRSSIRWRAAIMCGVLLLASTWGWRVFEASHLKPRVESVVQNLIVSKAKLQDGVRELSNKRALEIVKETYGLGVGMGSNRASSFFASLVSNTGVLGAALFCAMLLSLLWRYVRAPALTDMQIFVAVALPTATLAMGLGIPDLNLPMYWGFIFLAFVFCPEPIKSGSDPN
jgi:hypothetical protein